MEVISMKKLKINLIKITAFILTFFINGVSLSDVSKKLFKEELISKYYSPELKTLRDTIKYLETKMVDDYMEIQWAVNKLYELRDAKLGIKPMPGEYFTPGTREFVASDWCWTGPFTIVGRNWDKLPYDVRKDLEPLFIRPDDPQSGFYGSTKPITWLKYETPNFVLHYTYEGRNAMIFIDKNGNQIPDMIEWIGDAYEKGYRVQCGAHAQDTTKKQYSQFGEPILGFKEPIRDIEGITNEYVGDARWDIYVMNDPGTGWLQFTTIEWPAFFRMQAFRSYWVSPAWFAVNTAVNVEYADLIEARAWFDLGSTHEFHHAIQFGYNFMMSRWLMESYSVWSEYHVWDGLTHDNKGNFEFDPLETNAYYWDYGRWDYGLRYPEYSLDDYSLYSYSMTIWQHYLEDRFGFQIHKDIFRWYANPSWSLFVADWNFYHIYFYYEKATSFAEVMKEFKTWWYFTGPRTGKYVLTEEQKAKITPIDPDNVTVFGDYRFTPYNDVVGFDLTTPYRDVTVRGDNYYTSYPAQNSFSLWEIPQTFGTHFVLFDKLPPEAQDWVINFQGSPLRGHTIINRDQDDSDVYENWGVYGWAVRLIVHFDYGTPDEFNDDIIKVTELFPTVVNQSAQIRIGDLVDILDEPNGNITRICMIVFNMEPYINWYQSYSYYCGPPPQGTITNLSVTPEYKIVDGDSLQTGNAIISFDYFGETDKVVLFKYWRVGAIEDNSLTYKGYDAGTWGLPFRAFEPVSVWTLGKTSGSFTIVDSSFGYYGEIDEGDMEFAGQGFVVAPYDDKTNAFGYSSVSPYFNLSERSTYSLRDEVLPSIVDTPVIDVYPFDHINITVKFDEAVFEYPRLIYYWSRDPNSVDTVAIGTDYGELFYGSSAGKIYRGSINVNYFSSSDTLNFQFKVLNRGGVVYEDGQFRWLASQTMTSPYYKYYYDAKIPNTLNKKIRVTPNPVYANRRGEDYWEQVEGRVLIETFGERKNFIVKIIDPRGYQVRILDEEGIEIHSVKGMAFWDVKDDFGNDSGSGVYYIVAEADNYSQITKLVVIRD